MTGRQVVLNSDVIEQFHSGLRGGHLLRGDDGYDSARKIYNATIDHRPAIIARCAGATDVISAVNFARNNGLLVSVRGGGQYCYLIRIPASPGGANAWRYFDSPARQGGRGHQVL